MQVVPTMNDVNPLNSGSVRGRNDPEAVKAVAREMEALFAYELIKVMRETVQTSSQGTLGNDTYMTMFDMELSRLFAERGLGLQGSLEKGLTSIARKAGKAAPDLPLPEQSPKRSLPMETITPSPGEQTTLPPMQSRGQRLKQALQAEIKTLLPDIAHGRVSSDYGVRSDPFSGEQKFHHGVDIPAPEGTTIHAVQGGTVTFSGKQRGYGNVVIIDHGDGFMTKYAHNQKNLVREGDAVEPGSVIAQVGSTGKSTGSHIHFEVLYKGRDVSPGTLLAKG